jgi:hypothetical protein
VSVSASSATGLEATTAFLDEKFDHGFAECRHALINWQEPGQYVDEIIVCGLSE